ncbi:hypothetical protein Ct9H90mP29_09350 [bacterium]|nr:MAG: hypothetical protein Ct9H90mP29_09350 [bacterium]
MPIVKNEYLIMFEIDFCYYLHFPNNYRLGYNRHRDYRLSIKFHNQILNENLISCIFLCWITITTIATFGAFIRLIYVDLN